MKELIEAINMEGYAYAEIKKNNKIPFMDKGIIIPMLEEEFIIISYEGNYRIYIIDSFNKTLITESDWLPNAEAVISNIDSFYTTI